MAFGLRVNPQQAVRRMSSRKRYRPGSVNDETDPNMFGIVVVPAAYPAPSRRHASSTSPSSNGSAAQGGSNGKASRPVTT